MCMCLSVCKISKKGRKGEVGKGSDRVRIGLCLEKRRGWGVGMLFDFEGQWVGSFLKIKKIKRGVGGKWGCIRSQL